MVNKLRIKNKVSEKDILSSTINPNGTGHKLGGGGMKMIMTFAVIVAICFLTWQMILNKNTNKSIIVAGNTITIRNNYNVYHGEVLGLYSDELRIYGLTDMRGDDDWSPVGYADFLIMGSEWTGYTAECERNDAMNAGIINVITGDEQILSEIKKLEEMNESRRRAEITGSEVKIHGYYYEGEDHSDSLKQEGKIDPGSAILIESITIHE